MDYVAFFDGNMPYNSRNVAILTKINSIIDLKAV